MVILLIVALVALIGVVGLVVLVLFLCERAGRRRTPDADLPPDVLGLRQEVAALRAEAKDALRHLGIVRYDAFEEMGGHLSWSLALLDDGGNGVVLTSIHGRSDARSYAKSVADWKCEQQLSPEETSAISSARRG